MGSEQWSIGYPATGEPFGFWSVDVATLRSKLDPSMSELFGLDPAVGAAGLEQERLALRIHPDDRARAARCLHEAIKSRGPYSYRYRLRTEGGEFLWVQATGRAFMDEDDRVTHLAGVLTELAQPSAKPLELEVIERLMETHELAKLSSDPMLPRLIEAVLLHAGRELAKGMVHPDRG